MAPPAVTSRGTPTDPRMRDGFRSTIAFSAQPAISIYETEVQLPGIDGGDGIETTTMLNSTYHTKAPNKLVKLNDVPVTFAYNPSALSLLQAMINVEQSITIHLPNNATWSFYGFLKSFEPEAFKMGTMPTAKGSIVCTNTDPTSGVEQGPVYAAPGGP